MRLRLERSGSLQLGEFTEVLLSLLFQLASKLLPLLLTLPSLSREIAAQAVDHRCQGVYSVAEGRLLRSGTGW